MGKLSPEEVAEFVATPPPREIPSKLRRRVRPRNKILTIVGTMFLLMGTLFSWIFLPRHPLATLALDSGPGEADGRVVAVHETHYSEGGSNHSSGTPIFAHEFGYTVDGRDYAGTCYVSGRKLKKDAAVTVEFLRDDPGIARIRGGRLDPYGLSVSFVLIFPIVGAGMLLAPTVVRRRKLALLRNGEFTFATVTEVQRTKVAVNNEQRYLVTTEFEAAAGRQTTRTTAYGDDVTLAQKRHDEGEKIGLLYDPTKPNRLLFTGRFLDDEWI